VEETMASRKPPSASEGLAILERIEWQGRVVFHAVQLSSVRVLRVSVQQARAEIHELRTEDPENAKAIRRIAARVDALSRLAARVAALEKRTA
jgi:ABC-type transport system involved in cytochrome bd biosynthesis fused ATPase/permease subunit